MLYLFPGRGDQECRNGAAKRQAEQEARGHNVGVEANKFREHIRGVQEEGSRYRRESGSAVAGNEHSQHGAGIDTEAAGTDRERHSADPERARGILVADMREEGVGGRGKNWMVQRRREREGGESEGGSRQFRVSNFKFQVRTPRRYLRPALSISSTAGEGLG